MGKLANEAGDGFLPSPARMDKDLELIKEGLSKLRKDSMDVGLDGGELENLRYHGAKASMTSIMQHLNLKKREVRFQGSWREKGESMPDTYLRESQTMVLLAQEKCLEYLRGGGDIYKFTGQQIKPGETPEVDAEDVARKSRAMECGLPEGAASEDLAKGLLDPAFGPDGKIREEDLKAEKESVKSWEADSILAASDEDVSKDEDLDLGSSFQDNPDPEEAWNEMDTEGMVHYWVQTKNAQGPAKLHLPAPLEYEGDVLLEAKPKCGIGGSFDYVKVDEAWDDAATLCKRCRPSTERGCAGICEVMHLGKDLQVRRRSRRCELEPGHKGSCDHKCSFHSEVPKAGEAKWIFKTHWASTPAGKNL